jgi:hypothetical protein
VRDNGLVRPDNQAPVIRYNATAPEHMTNRANRVPLAENFDLDNVVETVPDAGPAPSPQTSATSAPTVTALGSGPEHDAGRARTTDSYRDSPPSSAHVKLLPCRDTFCRPIFKSANTPFCFRVFQTTRHTQENGFHAEKLVAKMRFWVCGVPAPPFDGLARGFPDSWLHTMR